MAGTVSLSGLASGMDVGSIIDALVTAQGTQQSALKSRITATKSASTAISDIGSLLSKLKTAVDVVADPQKAQGYAATSSNAAVSASITGAASAGRYSVAVKSLAQAYRAYSDPAASTSTALGQSGEMKIDVGDTRSGKVSIDTSDTLTSIAQKINAANLGVQATTFYDGSQYRLQVSGTDTGDDNRVTISGVELGLNGVNNKKQQAQDAHIVVDDFDVYSSTNKISGALPGVTLNLAEETTSAATVVIKSDPDALKTKLQAVVDAYNAVVGKVHSTAGYGSTTASNALLAGDSTLRSLTSRMSNAVTSVVDTGTTYQSLSSIGISITRDGTMSLDSSKFSTALSASPDAVTKLMAGTASTDGVMDVVSNVVDTFNNGNTGLLAGKRNMLNSNATRLQSRADEQQERLDNYRALLEKQFSAMEEAYSNANTVASYLSALGG